MHRGNISVYKEPWYDFSLREDMALDEEELQREKMISEFCLIKKKTYVAGRCKEI